MRESNPSQFESIEKQSSGSSTKPMSKDDLIAVFCLDNLRFVESMYKILLGRASDADGKAHFLDLIAHAETTLEGKFQVVRIMLASPEHQKRPADQTSDQLSIICEFIKLYSDTHNRHSRGLWSIFKGAFTKAET